MPRDLVFGNGHLLVNIDKHFNIRDIYYPYVGQLNHVAGYYCRVGVWTADVGFAWLGDEWQRELAYQDDTLVSDCTAKLARLGLTLHFQHAVDPYQNLFVQRIAVTNHWKADRKIRLFYAYDLRIDESDIGDTAMFHPYTGAMIHYKRDRFLLASGTVGEPSAMSGIAQYACGIKEFGGAEGTWRDAEDGQLSGNAIAQGSVDSVIGFDMPLPSEGTETLRTWIAVGPDLESVVTLHQKTLEAGVDAVLERTAMVTKSWTGINPEGLDEMPDRVQKLYRRSLLVIRSQMDHHGAIIASSDSDIMQTARAHYAYVWPRDGGLVAYPLDKLGMTELTIPFYKFCCEALAKSPLQGDSPDGHVAALMHKYCPDGSLGASWHPWVLAPQGREVPIQEDGTALVVWSAAQHAMGQEDTAWVDDLFERLILPGALFLVQHRSAETHLPLPSWDIWEERRGIHLFTASAVVAALRQAAALCVQRKDEKHAALLNKAANETAEALESFFWDDEKGRFVRMLLPDEATGGLIKDYTIDSSMFAVFGYGVLPADHPKVAATMGAIGRALWVKTGIGGLARYENDYYFRVPGATDIKQIPGNPWIICTLWLADWMIATSKTRSELVSALDLLEWAAVCALPTGVLPEQIHPLTYEPLSVAPLTWSHAQFVTSVLSYLDKFNHAQHGL